MGKYCHGAIYCAAGSGNLATVFTMLTIGDRITFTCLTDEKITKNPQEIIDIFVKLNKENMKTIKE